MFNYNSASPAPVAAPVTWAVGMGRAYAPRHPGCNVRSLRAACETAGHGPAKVAATLAAGLAAHKAGKPLPWPNA